MAGWWWWSYDIVQCHKRYTTEREKGRGQSQQTDNRNRELESQQNGNGGVRVTAYKLKHGGGGSLANKVNKWGQSALLFTTNNDKRGGGQISNKRK